MPYARFDDRWDDHKKIKRALRREPAVVAMHAMAITYSNRHNSDGNIDLDWVEEKLALMPYKAPQRQRILKLLFELRLFETKDDETVVVHDFLDWNLSSEQRHALSEQGKKGGQARSRGSSQPEGPGPGPGPGSSQGLGNGQSGGSSQAGSGGSSTPLATPSQAKPSQAKETRQRVNRRVDQSKPPDHFPANLTAVLDAALPILHGIWEVRGGVEPQPRGVGLSLLRNPAADHLSVVRKLEHWMLAGRGQHGRCGDVTARFGDWVENEGAASNVVSLGSSSHLPESHRVSSEWTAQLEAHINQQQKGST